MWSDEAHGSEVTPHVTGEFCSVLKAMATVRARQDAGSILLFRYAPHWLSLMGTSMMSKG